MAVIDKDNNRKGGLGVVEGEVDDLLNEVGDLVQDIDLSAVELDLPEPYMDRAWALRRIHLVREANLARVNMAGNKVHNPEAARKIEQDYRAMLWQIGLIDRQYPHAKRLSRQIAELIAAEESAQDEQRRQALPRRS